MSKILPVTASFSIYQDHRESKVETKNKMGDHGKIKRQSPCEKNYKDFGLQGECYYLVDEDVAAVTVHIELEESVVKRICAGVRLYFTFRKDEKKSFQTLTKRKQFKSKTETL